MIHLQKEAAEKARAKQLRVQMKGKDVEKEHKFWNTQVSGDG